MIKGEEAGAGPEEAAPTSAESECMASITHVHTHGFKRHVDDGENIHVHILMAAIDMYCAHITASIYNGLDTSGESH